MNICIIYIASCWMTQQEKVQAKKNCEELGLWYGINWYWEIVCSYYKEEPVMKCIKEYTNWIDEKYNNPDTVSNLREDDYSKVVETCNNIFWLKNKWKQ